MLLIHCPIIFAFDPNIRMYRFKKGEAYFWLKLISIKGVYFSEKQEHDMFPGNGHMAVIGLLIRVLHQCITTRN